MEQPSKWADMVHNGKVIATLYVTDPETSTALDIEECSLAGDGVWDMGFVGDFVTNQHVSDVCALLGVKEEDVDLR